ncbi:hypothetical protein F2P44_31675 [Massilia sp. CCM 8695]|uniref:Lipoprotein n=1 Tax=Massilia frigida TaxID=2609281 RepID=A0ABX0NJ72_9BURK|nr:hypothetical protein [Massilia frigida]NHZ83794.1 hypothetical protein [Massilia frigida]
MHEFMKFLICPLLFSGLVACTSHQPIEKTNRAEVAAAMFHERCKLSGEKIYRTVKDVDGIFLLKIRPQGENFSSQYLFDDPYGNDLGGQAYIRSFLHGSHLTNLMNMKDSSINSPSRTGYSYVDVVEPADGKRYRYTGRIEEPALTDSAYLKGYMKFTHSRILANVPAPRYGITYEDISTRADRDYWIAGSSLKIIDLNTNEVIAERVGYLYDAGQGETSGGRAPWIWAADHSCPSFGPSPAFSSQQNQTVIFAEKVLHPLKGK